jgi:hypothetical protein
MLATHVMTYRGSCCRWSLLNNEMQGRSNIAVEVEHISAEKYSERDNYCETIAFPHVSIILGRQIREQLLLFKWFI